MFIDLVPNFVYYHFDKTEELTDESHLSSARNVATKDRSEIKTRKNGHDRSDKK